MTKAVGKAIPGRWRHHRNTATYLVQYLLHATALPWCAMQLKVEQRKLQLTHHHHAGLEVACGQHALQHFSGQWLAGLPVTGNQRQPFLLPAPVFHKLAGQLDRIPGHAIDTGYAQLFNPGQHVVQAMAKFVEQGSHFIVGQQRRLVAHCWGKVAHQIGHRQHQLTLAIAELITGAIHPGTAALVAARIEVEVETTHGLAVFLHLEQTHLWVPALKVLLFADLDTEQALHNLEHAIQHSVDWEVLTYLFFADAVALLAQFFAVVTQVPALQVDAALAGSKLF